MKIISLIALCVFATLTFAKDSKPAQSSAGWDKLADDFLSQVYYKFNPTTATSDGLHEYDAKLEGYSKADVDHRIATLKAFKTRVEAVDGKSLDYDRQVDRDLVLGYINSRLLSLEDIRGWEKNPDPYQSNITNSIFVIMARKYAPADQRLKAVIAREKQMPAVFTAARANLKNPPRIYTEIALQQTPGIVSFFEKDVPSAFNEVKDQKLLAEFKASNAAVIAALNDYQKWMKSDLLPRSNGSFAIGADNYRKKLLYDEGVDIPLERLLEIGTADLRKNQEWFKETAKQIDPSRDPQDILKEMQKDHPDPAKLLDAYSDLLGGLRGYVADHHIMTIPSQEQPTMEETPPFERATTFASMDTPGPFEKVAKESFFNVTLPEPTWSKEEIEEHMAGNARPVMLAVAVHEVWPGHFMQHLWTPLLSSKVRKVLGCGTSGEGWAHYTEQMMLDEHVAKDDPKMRLGQLQDALLRDARYIVGIKMHTQGMTTAEAEDFFVKEGYQTHSIGSRETKRGTADPTYLVYTLGKLQIMKLREDYKQKIGEKFSLQDFHDKFMKHGFVPIKYVRKDMMGDDSPVL